MRKLLLGMGYFTWLVCNLAIIYGVGWGVFELIKSTSVGEFLLKLAGGMITLFLLVILSVLILGLIAMMFDDEKVIKKFDEIFKSK
jgi:hypothetical protein